MKVFYGRAGLVSEKRSATFSGVVWADPIMPTTDKVTVGSVCFSPGARTFWHSHGQGQILQVTSGRGFVCLDGGEPQAIRAGDVVWIAANERHWHGASGDSYMVHTATSLGVTSWAEEVLEEVYRKAVGEGVPRIA
jgi:quercetin dioxygenase-like cupin family protein